MAAVTEEVLTAIRTEIRVGWNSEEFALSLRNIWQSQDFATVINTITDTRASAIEARLLTVEQQAGTYITQIKEEVEKTQEQWKKSMTEMNDYVVFLDETRNEMCRGER